jgi:hypothetical protein
MTFEETKTTIYSMFFDNINKNPESLTLCCEFDNHLNALNADYDRLLAINNQLRVENVELEKRIEELE